MRTFSVVAPLAGADGYGQSAERLILAARGLGADVQFVSHDWKDDRFSDSELVSSEVGEEWLRDVVVVYFLPFAFQRFGSKVTIGQTMFETDSIPPFWVPSCNSTNGIIVPSEHCREAFQPHLSVPVRVVPLGVDTEFYRPVVRPQSGTFTFLMAGLLHYRKGAEFAVRAFCEEFGPREDVRLVLKTRRGFLDLGDSADLGSTDRRIKVFDEDYTREQMRGLYARADCFLAPSRGEASGLTPREAMATGLPTILTDWGGLREIADENYAYPLAVERLEPAPPECSSYHAAVAGTQPIGNFALPSVSHLRALMREVYEDRQGAREKGRRAAAVMQGAWNWKLCAERWLEVVEELSVAHE